MNCVELQESLAEAEDRTHPEQKAHLVECPSCSELVRELDWIIASAEQLQSADEPSPRVWNSIAESLRQEGLIRPQRRPALSSFGASWGATRWLVPAAAMLLLSIGVYVRRGSVAPPAPQQVSVAATPAPSSDLSDDDLMQEVAANTPAMRTQYEDSLRRVNDSIREAQGELDENPNDDDARRFLMNAYEQKSMLFQMAMDRSLP